MRCTKRQVPIPSGRHPRSRTQEITGKGGSGLAKSPKGGAPGEAERRNAYVSNALVRGLNILRLFGPEHATLSLADVARLLGETRASCFRYLYTLQHLGYLEQDAKTKRFQLTPKVMELGFAYLNSQPLIDVARPEMERLRDLSQASCHLGVLDGTAVVYIARVPAHGVTSIHIAVGARLPVYATAMGKVLLAHQPAERVESLLAALPSITRFTETTVRDVEALRKELESVRERGFAFSDGEYEAEVRSVAVPIFNGEGVAEAAINLAGSKTAFTLARLHEVLPEMFRAGERLSRFKGYFGRYQISEMSSAKESV